MKINIKNMVCNRCIMVVSQIFKEAGIQTENMQLGTVTLKSELVPGKMEKINTRLKTVGFEIINDAKSRLIEKIKTISIEYVYQHNEEKKLNFSDYLVGKLNLDYPYLSSLFSSVEGTTIEKYLIHLKIERVKELLVYDEKTLSEIAWEMGYSSVAHLSGQFKKVTGFTPSYFKKLGEKKRNSIDDV
ncbi:AraC family transcriptional regulator [Maribellus sp. YY47]|uniref:helix-turn-helix domain-containing protein n=1 Tax=Maribellus sp. YY47 TaxID=2929486 RepID=UPI0020010F3F|nr:AraC family transcriptional regulator [Maribellus sp. YY47]MCK3683774.1 AraC family transcriptional regulator [Maribellus sp. YY47]